MNIDECIAFLRWKSGQTRCVTRFKRMSARNAAFWLSGRQKTRPGPRSLPSGQPKRGVSRVHPHELSNVSRFSGFSPQKRDTFVDFHRFLKCFELKTKGIQWKPIIFRSPASRGQGSKNHRFPLNSFWKSTIFDAGSTRRSQESKNHRFSKGIQRKSMIFGDPASRGRADERPGIEK